MEKPKQGEPTFATPILVGSGPGVDRATDFLLTALEWMFREDNPALLYPVEGEISNWIEQLWEKPYQAESPTLSVTTNMTTERDMLREALALFADPRNEEEKQIARHLGAFSLEEIQRVSSALHSNNGPGIEAVQSEIVDRLGKQIKDRLTPSRVSGLASIIGRCRAGRAVAMCPVLHKSDARVLINRARRGDARAVLDLIKVDKLFLTDSCTAKVIRQAEFQNDHPFFKQLARAITYKPQLGSKKGCRLYLYALFAMAVPLPPLGMLHFRVDPQGTRFRTFPAFEKFVERCRKDFDKIQDEFLAENRKEPKPGDIQK
jgi:hypothetical protein